MQKLQCELCGSVDIIKTDENVFQCQFCGCKYTLEQARTLIMGDVVKTRASDFEIVGGVLKKYHGESTDVIVPDNVLKIESGAFSDLLITSVNLPERLVEIGGEKGLVKGAFQDCKYLKRINFPDRFTDNWYESFLWLFLSAVSFPS